MIQIVEPGKRKGVIHIPSSKSDTQRALLIAGLAKGTSTISNVGDSADETAMLNTIKQLGANIEQIESKTYLITGTKKFPDNATINIGESGLGCRLITNVCASQNGSFIVEGKGSLLKRPMPFFENVLPKLGAKVNSTNGFIPIHIEGPMTGGEITFEGKDSSQYLSGLLIAAPLMISGTTSIYVTHLNSLPYVKMTLNTMAKFGVTVQHRDFKDYIISSNQKYYSCDYTIESDWSSASYWLVASALGMNIQMTGLSFSSLQADKAMIKALEKANCKIDFLEETLRIDGRNRMPFEFDATDCPDLFPALVAFAALTKGESKIKGVTRLTHKESNRGVVLKEEFGKLGIRIDLNDDWMTIHGQTSINGGKVESHNDHRIAMCLGIIGLYANSPIEIEGSEAVKKSYPRFWKDLEGLEKNKIM